MYSQTALIRVSLIRVPKNPNIIPGNLFYHFLFTMIQYSTFHNPNTFYWAPSRSDKRGLTVYVEIYVLPMPQNPLQISFVRSLSKEPQLLSLSKKNVRLLELSDAGLENLEMITPELAVPAARMVPQSPLQGGWKHVPSRAQRHLSGPDITHATFNQRTSLIHPQTGALMGLL